MDPLLVRALGLYVPMAAVGVACAVRRPSRQVFAGALLATLWNLPALLVVQLLAMFFAWWMFDARGGILLGMPVDLYLGWALLWGALPVLVFRRLPLAVLVALAVAMDVLWMPACEPVLVLGPHWLGGEAAAVLLSLIPAQLLGRWTAEQTHLRGRVALQIAGFLGTMLLVTTVILENTGGGWNALTDLSAEWASILLQLLFVPVLFGLTAALEFAERGDGTPLPYDPPRRLVTSGVYAYVANPMQLSMTVALTAWGVVLRSPWVAAAGGMCFIYSAGIAAWHENLHMRERFGEAWDEYRRAVRSWVPTWRPRFAPSAVRPRLYVAETCGVCSELRRWLERRRPRGLEIVAAEDHPTRDLARLTYAAPGAPEVDGVRALARALEHVHLGWALAGWTLRLPGVVWLAQNLADAVGFGPRLVPRRCAVPAQLAKENVP